MKYGFRIVYHKDIPLEDLGIIKSWLEDKVVMFTSEKSYKVGYNNSHSFYRRGIFGLLLNKPKNKYTFRRLSKNRRIFGIVPIDKLQGIKEEISLNMCMCADHLGGIRVKLKKKFNENDWITFYETGEIKG